VISTATALAPDIRLHPVVSERVVTLPDLWQALHRTQFSTGWDDLVSWDDRVRRRMAYV